MTNASQVTDVTMSSSEKKVNNYSHVRHLLHKMCN